MLCNNRKFQKKLKYMKDKEAASGGTTRQEEIDIVKRKYPSQDRKYSNNDRRKDSLRAEEKKRNVNSQWRLVKSSTTTIKNCTRCGYNHNINKCPAYGKTCSNCSLPNHFARVCRNKRQINEISSNIQENETSLSIDTIESNKYNYCSVDLEINNNKTNLKARFKVDTGASANIISVNQLTLLEINVNKIQRNTDVLTSYTGDKVPILGTCYLNFKCNNRCLENVEFYVVKGKNDSILGLKTSTELGLIKLNSSVSINSINSESNKNYDNLIHKYKDIFQGIRKISKPYHIDIKDNAKPIVRI